MAGAILVTLVTCSVFFFFRLPPDPDLAYEYAGDPGSSYWETSTFFPSEKEEIIIIPPSSSEEAVPIQHVLFEYLEIRDSCGVHFQGECVNVRSGPGTDFPAITQVRNNVVLKVEGKIERDGYTWFKIAFDEWLRYPERVTADWYVAGEYADVVLNEGDKTIWDHQPASTTKRIVVSRSSQTLTAYEDDVVVMHSLISTGRELTPTPRGTFSVFKKTPSRYMQGPLPGISDQYYDLPGVPWNLYFSHEGAVIHGAYWHDSFGEAYSHGCVNLPPDTAKELYEWAELGTKITVED